MQISKYKIAKLSDYAEIQPGYAFKSEQFTDDPTDIPLVKGENVQQGFIDWEASKYWPAEAFRGLEKYYLQTGDVVLAMDRPWVTSGLKWAFIKKHDPKAFLVQRVARLRSKQGLDQTYLRCLISSQYFSNYVQPIVTGVNVPHISSKQIGDFKIPLPSIKVQEKVAAILSAYDDLIENDKRRIVLLEKMAEEIYREWFVRMRFPGHEKVRFKKGVPVDWEIAKLGDVLELLYGKALKESDRADGDFAVYGSGGIVGTHNKAIVKGPGIIVGRKGNVGSVHWSNSDFYPIDTVYYVKSNFNLCFIYFLLQSMSFINNDAAVPGLNRSQAYSNRFYFPKTELIESYGKIAEPIFSMKFHLNKKIKILETSRDMLLGRLISGKLPVDNLDIHFPPSMQPLEDKAHA